MGEKTRRRREGHTARGAIPRDLHTAGSKATLGELAAELDISRERVRQLQNEAEQLLKSETRRVPRRAARRRSLDLQGEISA